MKAFWIFLKNALFAFLLGAFILLGIASIFVPISHPISRPYSYAERDGERGKTYFWNLPYISKSRENKKSPALEQIIRDANEALTWGLFSVVDKTRVPPSGNRHDFCDLSPYFWPNPLLPGGKPYYYRDGLVNPESNSDIYDRARYLQLLRALQRLSLGYYFSGNEVYAQRAALLLRTWFIHPDTRMTPHFQHSQIIPGINDGVSLGVIRATELVQILDTLALIAPSRAWTAEDHRRLVEWFRDYLRWATTSSFGEREFRMRNNHGTWYDASTSAIAYFCGNPEIARDILSRSARRRIDIQISSNGDQPIETRRSRSFYYAIYNLRGLFALAEMCERSGIDLWNYKGIKGQSLRIALDYLIPYAIGEKKWTGKIIIPDEGWIADFIPLLKIAADKYDDPRYLDVLKKLPPIGKNRNVWALWNLPPPQAR